MIGTLIKLLPLHISVAVKTTRKFFFVFTVAKGDCEEKDRTKENIPLDQKYSFRTLNNTLTQAGNLLCTHVFRAPMMQLFSALSKAMQKGQ